MLPTKFGSSGQAVSKTISKTRLIRNNNCLWRPYLLMDRDEMGHLYTGPPIIAFYQVSVHLATRFNRRFYFRNQPIRKKSCLWLPCLLLDRDKMSNLHREPPIEAFYQVSVHLATPFQRRRILKISQSETKITCGGHVC